MEIVAKISKGSRMDQIYLPKNRIGFSSGQHVLITSLENRAAEKKAFKPLFYNIKKLEQIKVEIINKIFSALENISAQNIIIVGSFLEKGFKFNDIDILIIRENSLDIKPLKDKIEENLGINIHILLLSTGTLLAGLATDPMYSLMISKCASRNRIILRTKRDVNYKLLDFHLLKSKALIDNSEILNGEEKYYLLLNMFSILLFMQNKKLSREIIDKKIEEEFNLKIKDIKNNMIKKDNFVKKCKEVYNKTFSIIMENVK